MKFRTLGLALALGSLSGVVLAQATLPLQANITPTDEFQVIPHGAASARSVYVTAPQLTAQYGYYKSSPATGFSYTFGANVTKAVFTPSTTLATAHVTMPATPNDGQQACIYFTNIVTTLTVSANTGQSIVDNAAAIAALAHNCYIYSMSNATWNRNE